MISDFGLTKELLEAEIFAGNLKSELMAEEAMENILQEATGSSFKEKFQKLIDLLNEAWKKFVAAVNSVINKILVASKTADKLIDQHKKEISEFKSASEPVNITEGLVNPSKISMAVRRVDFIKFLANKIVTMDFVNGRQLDTLRGKMTATRQDVDRIVSGIITEKKPKTVDKRLLDQAVNFIKKEYPGTVDRIKGYKADAEKVMQANQRELVKQMHQEGASETQARQRLWAYSSFCRDSLNFILGGVSSLIKVMNATYMDSYKVVRKAVSVSKKTNQGAEVV
jgi:phospholipid N-methyltransferase